MRVQRQLDFTTPVLPSRVAGSSCPLCGEEKSRFVIADGDSSLYRCRRCAFLFVLPRPTADELKALYTDEYFAGDDMAAATLPFRAPVFRQCLETLQHLLPRRGRLLDVGCWTGDFVEAANYAGFSASGIDLSIKAARFAANVRKLDVHGCTLCSAPYPSASFDAVTMLDVLEHVLDPVAELKHAQALLRPAAILVVRVPNTDFHLAKTRVCRMLNVSDIGLQTRYHLNHFTPRTLRFTLQHAGFEVLLLQVGAPELIAHAAWATPWAKRAYVRFATSVHRFTHAHVENITVAYARRKD
jgi:2-polyprenyl-3-methyl-5-hydroxy-6-metoxy-1,4-benzoquinol methylase